MVKWNEFVAWLFFALLSYFAYDMNSTMKEVSHSVNDLNKNVAVMIFQGENHEERIKGLEDLVLKRKK